MAKLPRLSGKEVVKALNKAGFISIRQKGSHNFMRKETQTEKITTVVPMHKEIDTGTLLEIIRQCKMTREDFLKLL
ncbi:type II toxin-antitoxin system HicA family toxin [Candidatus Pacearchaeota archaeon]|nr:type II toxin-antitoxin system HicA family toxin [Candidatus Pacearchaeota archaeon]